MTDAQAGVRALLDSRSEAIWSKDLDRLMSYYSPDVIYFDIVPPLQYVGTAALRDRFSDWFGSYDGPIRQEIRNLNVVATEDIAATCMLIHAGGTLNSGQEVALWVRATSYCRRSSDRWLITHEHVSLPVDLQSGSAIRDLEP